MKKGIKSDVWRIVAVALFSVIGVSLVSCDDSENSGSARLEIRLTDAPGLYEEVNVDIQEVRVHTGDDDDDKEDDDSGWKSISIRKGVYDLIKLTDGIDTLLGTIDLPPGKISQIRLILGTNNTVKINGQLFPLTTPSAQQSGLKVQVHQELKEGVTYKVLLDFDAALSVVARGNGDYNLKPVIRAVTEAVDGAIEGTVQPIASNPNVYAIIGTDTTSTSTDLLTGHFIIRGLQPGEYRVVFVPRPGYESEQLLDVDVMTGNVTDVGVVTIDPQ